MTTKREHGTTHHYRGEGERTYVATTAPHHKRATHGHDDVTLVWRDADHPCCEHQRGWKEGDALRPWDTTGCGTWMATGHVQCGNCGSLVGPVVYSAPLVDATDDDVESAIDDLEDEWWEARPTIPERHDWLWDWDSYNLLSNDELADLLDALDDLDEDEYERFDPFDWMEARRGAT